MSSHKDYEATIREPLKLKGGSSKKKKTKKKKTLEEHSSSEPKLIRNKTEAEIKFEKIQKKRLKEKVESLAAKSHKDKVKEFNEKLDKLSEHYDIPKVGPG